MSTQITAKNDGDSLYGRRCIHVSLNSFNFVNESSNDSEMLALTMQCQFPAKNMMDCERTIAVTHKPRHSMIEHTREHLTAIDTPQNAMQNML